MKCNLCARVLHNDEDGNCDSDCSCSSSLCVGEDQERVDVRGDDGVDGCGEKGREMVPMAWFVLVFMFVALCRTLHRYTIEVPLILKLIGDRKEYNNSFIAAIMTA